MPLAPRFSPSGSGAIRLRRPARRERSEPDLSIDSLQNEVEYAVTLGAGPDTVCVVNGTPVGNAVEPDPDDQQDEEVPTQVPAIPFAGLAGLALALMGGTARRRRQAVEWR